MYYEFEGKRYDVPDWAIYLAMDGDGSVWAYEKPPKWDADDKYWYNDSYDGRDEKLNSDTPGPIAKIRED